MTDRRSAVCGADGGDFVTNRVSTTEKGELYKMTIDGCG